MPTNFHNNLLLLFIAHEIATAAGDGMAFTEERLAIDDGLLPLPFFVFLVLTFGVHLLMGMGAASSVMAVVFLFPVAQNCLRKDVVQVYR
jgi:hypothetical protein